MTLGIKLGISVWQQTHRSDRWSNFRFKHETTHWSKVKIQFETTSTKTTTCSIWDKHRKFSLGKVMVQCETPPCMKTASIRLFSVWETILNMNVGMRLRFTGQHKQLDGCLNKIMFQFNTTSKTMNVRMNLFISVRQKA